MRDGFIVRDDLFPLVTTVYPTRIAWDHLAPYFDAYARLLARERPFVSLVDMRPCLHMPDAKVRREMAAWGNRIEDDRERLVLGVAFVITHPLLRAALSAVQLVAPPRQPVIRPKTPEEGLTFLYGKLRDRGLATPDMPTLWRDAESVRALMR